MTTTDEWVTAALIDDAVVVELLFRLKQSSSPSFLSPPSLRWGHRQARSKPAAISTSKKDCESMRCSPTTPLSWSCDGDVSPGDGSDESSRPSDHSSGSRSKGDFTSDTITTTTINKRSRKKKSFDELREEESLLLKERIQLKNDLANVHVAIKEQKARSENLKRIKLDLQLEAATKMAVNSRRPTLPVACNLESHVPVSPPINTTPQKDFPFIGSSKVEKEVETTEGGFVLPDLNMMPSEEDSGCETPNGLS